jgi:hypothetical protein
MESDGRWLTFKGTGTYTAQPLGYDWRVRLRVMFGLWFLAKDGYDEEDGWGGAWVYGIKSMGERRGSDVRAMQAVRNLAELAWVPDLAISEPGLHWSDAGESAFEIACQSGTRQVSVRFEVDDHGDVVRATSDRLYPEPEGYVEAPWRCEFGEPREFGGVRVPSRMTATYDLEDGTWEYMHVEVTTIDRDDGT